MSRRIEIIRRATELFEKQGVKQTSMEDIANAVGIKREGIYYYFKNRREILLEIILPSSVELQRNLRNILRSDMTSVEKLHAAIEAHLHRYDPGYLEMTVALREDHFFKEDKRLRALRSVWKGYTNDWQELIRGGQASGEFAPDANPKVVAFGVLGMCNWLARWFDPGKSVTIEEIIATYSNMLTHGLTSVSVTAKSGPDQASSAGFSPDTESSQATA
ncbi:MAG: TetR/AcrR family transcriptional regulator [Sphingomonadales bacterium]